MSIFLRIRIKQRHFLCFWKAKEYLYPRDFIRIYFGSRYHGVVSFMKIYGSRGHFMARVLDYCDYVIGISQGVCEVTANDKFVLFLKKRQAGDYYSQSDAAEPYSKLGELIQICNLERRYPQGTFIKVTNYYTSVGNLSREQALIIWG